MFFFQSFVESKKAHQTNSIFFGVAHLSPNIKMFESGPLSSPHMLLYLSQNPEKKSTFKNVQ